MVSHAFGRMTGEGHGLNFTLSKRKHVLVGNRLCVRSRHIGVVSIGPGGEEIPRFERRLTLLMNVNRHVVERDGEMGGASRNGKTTGGEQKTVGDSVVQQSLNAFDLKGLIPRGPSVDQDVAQRTGDEHDVPVVVNPWKTRHLHASLMTPVPLNIPKRGGCD